MKPSSRGGAARRGRAAGSIPGCLPTRLEGDPSLGAKRRLYFKWPIFRIRGGGKVINPASGGLAEPRAPDAAEVAVVPSSSRPRREDRIWRLPPAKGESFASLLGHHVHEERGEAWAEDNEASPSALWRRRNGYPFVPRSCSPAREPRRLTCGCLIRWFAATRPATAQTKSPSEVGPW